MKLYIDNKSVDLGINSEINLTKYSTVFAPLSGAWSFPFTLPIANNLAIFNYANIPNIGGDARKIFKAQIWIDSIFEADGIAKIRSITDSTIVINVEATPGNISKSIWSSKLNTLDLGSETIETVSKKSQYFWATTWNNENLKLIITNPNYQYFSFFIFKNGERVNIGDTGIIDYKDVPPAERKVSTFKADAKTQFEKTQIEGVTITANDTEIGIKFSTIVNKVDMWIVGYPTLSRYEKLGDFTLSTINYKTIKDNYYNSKIDNEIYCLPEIQNFSFYDSQEDWNGIINKKVDGKIQLNTDEFQNRNTVIPQLKLVWLIKKILKTLGYEAGGSFLEHPEIKKIIVHNLFATDKQAGETVLAFNVHSEKITYANHTPDMSLVDFFQSIIDQFGVGIEFNTLSKTCDLFLFSEVFVQNSDFLNLSERVSFQYSGDFVDLKKKQLTFETSGDSLVTDTTEIFKSLPTDAEIKEESDNYEAITCRFPSLTMDEESGLVAIEMAGISPLFEQTKNTNPNRLLFFENLKASNKTANLSLSFYGENNIFDKFQKQKIAIENGHKPIKCKVLLTKQELLAFQFKQKIIAYDMLFLAESTAVKIKSEAELYDVELKMRTVVT